MTGIRGAAVALDPKTGAILAMVSQPTFDPNDLAGHDLSALDENYKKLNQLDWGKKVIAITCLSICTMQKSHP